MLLLEKSLERRDLLRNLRAIRPWICVHPPHPSRLLGFSTVVGVLNSAFACRSSARILCAEAIGSGTRSVRCRRRGSPATSRSALLGAPLAAAIAGRRVRG